LRVIVFFDGHRGLCVLQHILGHPDFHVISVVTPVSFDASLLTAPKASSNFAHLRLDDVNSPSSVELLRTYCPDVFLIAGFRSIFDAQLLLLPVLGTLNLHAGRLPQYRGGSPLNWQLINGEVFAGLTVIRVDAGIDTGPIMAETNFPIGARDTIAHLHKKANELFPALTVVALTKLLSKYSYGQPQSEIGAQYWHQRTDADGYLDFARMTAVEVDRVVRAITRPYNGAFSLSNNTKVRLYTTEIPPFCLRGVSGRVCWISRRGPYIVCSDKAVLVTEYRAEDQPDFKLTHGQRLE